MSLLFKDILPQKLIKTQHLLIIWKIKAVPGISLVLIAP